MTPARAIRSLKDQQLSNESGMNEHLGKPVDIPLLLETMERVIYDAG